MGDVVELSFTAPSRSTDKLPLRAATLNGVLCRGVEHLPCVPVAGFASGTAIATAGPNGTPNRVTWRDPLPAALCSGPRRLLRYRVEFFSGTGRSAGKSDAAYTAAGPPPAPVDALRVEGTRMGILLHWLPETPVTSSGAPPGETRVSVLLRREALDGGTSPAAAHGKPGESRRSAANSGARPAKPAPGGDSPADNVVWLDSNSSGPVSDAAGDSNGESSETLDTTAEPGVLYRYTALRRLTVTLGGRSIELRSAPSAPVELTLQDIYPPPAPVGLMAAGYEPGAAGSMAPQAPGGFAVDLIWQPVNDAGLIAGLAGYNVYRLALPAEAGQTASMEDAAAARGTRLNSTPVALPAFHDSTANPASAYRYSVTAVDDKGNESRATSVDVPASPNSQPQNSQPR